MAKADEIDTVYEGWEWFGLA